MAALEARLELFAARDQRRRPGIVGVIVPDGGHCCEAFAEAARPGDDDDPAAIWAGWSFWRRSPRRAWALDSCRRLKPIRLCPWCGRKLIIARPREVEAEA